MSSQLTTHPGVVLVKSHRRRAGSHVKRKGIRHKRVGRKKVELQDLWLPALIGGLGLGIIFLGSPDLGTGIILFAGVIGAAII